MSPRLEFNTSNKARLIVETELLQIRVPSFSRPDIEHFVTATFSCSCEHYRFTHKPCKHVRHVLDDLESK